MRREDYTLPADRRALVDLLNAYAMDPMGGGEALADDVQARLCDDLAQRPTAASFIAWLGDEPVGLINTFEAYSTFKAKPLLNVHDVAVLAAHRGRGVGQALLAACEALARERGCCHPDGMPEDSGSGKTTLLARRVQAWERLAREISPDLLARNTETIGLGDAVATAQRLLAGQVRGRVVVDVNR